jgi:hypothetical protein
MIELGGQRKFAPKQFDYIKTQKAESQNFLDPVLAKPES